MGSKFQGARQCMACSWYAAPIDRFSRHSDRLKSQPTIIICLGKRKQPIQGIDIELKKLFIETNP